MKNLLLFLPLAILLGIFVSPGLAQQKEFTIMGIMQHPELEGGCWYVQARQVKYELTGSPEDLLKCKVEGRQLTLRVRQARNLNSPCMIGHMVEIVQVVDTDFHPHNPPFSDKRIKGTVRRSELDCWYVLATDKKRYELQEPIPKKYMHKGAKYNRVSKVVPGSESDCGMDAVIIDSNAPLEKSKTQAKQKKNDPR